MQVAIVGPTGAVGMELLKLLEKRAFPLKRLRLFGSPASIGKKLSFKGELLPVEPIDFHGVDLAIFCTSRTVSIELAPLARSAGTIVIDNSSAFRLNPDVPLVIPEINGDTLKTHQGMIASPNCTTTIMLLPLAPLHRRAKIKRIVAATYQAASGAGIAAMEELKEETRAHLSNTPFERTVMPHPYAFNLFPHDSPLLPHGYAEEEMKMLHETRKILGDESIQVTATCVRVPVLRAHAEALNVEFRSELSKEEALALLRTTAGVTLLEDWENNRFPMPSDATESEQVFCGRLRVDQSQVRTLEMWVVGDQLLKGAALNNIQIAEGLVLLNKSFCSLG